jgi:hypothetical protein
MSRGLMWAALAAVVSFSIAPSQAQQAPVAERLAGTWMLVSLTGERDGRKTEPWGVAPQGILVLNANGRFAQIQMRSDRPKYASNNRTQGTPEEYKATATGVLTYYGRYMVNEAEGVLNFTIEASSFPNFDGTSARRSFTLTGDQLVTANPAAASGGSAISLIWRRDR